MQLAKPCRIIDVCLPPWDVLRVTRIDQDYLKAMLLQNLESRYPVDAGRLHSHARDAARSEPVSEIMQIMGEGAESADWHVIAVRIDRRHMHCGPDVDRGCARVQAGGVLRGR